MLQIFYKSFPIFIICKYYIYFTFR